MVYPYQDPDTRPTARAAARGGAASGRSGDPEQEGGFDMSPAAESGRPLRIAIIGAGPGGLCMGLRLKQAGFEDFVILDKAEGVGGTWFHNRYPGCAVDLPSFLYSFSFEKKYDWPRPYAPQSELLAYMEGVAEKYGLLPHCRLGQGVSRVVWQEDDARWRITMDSGETREAEIVVSAVGMFNDLVYPDIEGRDAFEGNAFHSARWDWDVDLAGKRIAVIGSAASAVQIVPEIVKSARQVHLFQRTANWVLPKEDVPYTPEQLEAFRRDPALLDAQRDETYRRIDEGMTFEDQAQLAEMERLGLQALEQVEDPAVREKLRPQHPYGCKRPLLSNEFYPAFNRPNLELVTEPIERITKTGVRTADGREREVDLIVYATGFSATKYLSALDVTGRAGRHIDDAWHDGANAYLGITTAGFPNLFMLYGPNTNNGSILEMIEHQTSHVLRHVQRIAQEGLAWVDVKPEAQAAYNEKVQAAIAEIPVWNHAVNGYYRSASGRVVTQWPFSMTDFKNMTEKLDLEAFEVG
jgi:cation diffusion facilitator CzcD-associated flavoprotein CzcO